MAGPLVGSRELVSNPEAAIMHDIGLQAERRGNFAVAHDSFSEALETLSSLPQTVDTIVQAARVTRDDGFTDLREAIIMPNDLRFGRARQTITRSAKATGSLLEGRLSDQASSTEMSKKVRRELRAEHGATVSLLGRIATVKQVVVGQYTGQVPAHLYAVGKEAYQDAHNDLRRGNNGYYRVSNAMVAARHERLNFQSTSRWLGRAAFGVAWTVARDPRNLVDAVRTFGSRLRHVRSYRAAVESITTYP